MTIQLINPADLPPQATYTQVAVAAGTAMVFIAGQEPEDVHGNSVAPGDLAGQARQVYANLGRALTAAGARPDQVAEHADVQGALALNPGEASRGQSPLMPVRHSGHILSRCCDQAVHRAGTGAEAAHQVWLRVSRLAGRDVG